MIAPPAGVLGLAFMGAAAAGDYFEFCARPGAATTPNKAAAIVTAPMIRLLMISSRAWAGRGPA